MIALQDDSPSHAFFGLLIWDAHLAADLFTCISSLHIGRDQGWQFFPAPPCFAPRGFSPPRKGDGAGMGQDFCPAPWGGAGMGLGFLDPPRHVLRY